MLDSSAQKLFVTAGVAQAVLAAIKEISRISEGRDALVEAGTFVNHDAQGICDPMQDIHVTHP